MFSRCSNQLIRKGDWTCLSCSIVTRTSQTSIAGLTTRPSAHTHQRKHSSSKTSSPPKDEPRAIATPSEAPAKGTKSAAKPGMEKRPSTRLSRGKSRDGLQETAGMSYNKQLLDLPSVPSTEHLHLNDIQIATFFSIHRPISVTQPVPMESTAAAFSSIFDAKLSPKYKPADVIYTMSSAVDMLENAGSSVYKQSGHQMTPEEIDLRQAVTQASSNAETTHHLDIPAKTLHFNLQELVKKFRPFNPPPAPVPMEFSEESSSNPQQNEGQNIPMPEPACTKKTYVTTLTVHEITQPNGQKTYRTHNTPLIENRSPYTDDDGVKYLPPTPRNQPFLGRMRERQLQHLDRLADKEFWSAISVKRQRKLKMKKHKYKKLMKRTKNLRRRLDKT